MTVRGPSGRLTTAPLVIIRNPVAGRRRERFFRRILGAIERQGVEAVLMETAHAGHAEQLAQLAVEQGCSTLVAAGGDGTINEVINGMVAAKAPERGVPLGIIPLGTANVLAVEMKLPKSSLGIARAITNGVATPLALGEINGRHFVMMAGAGFDAHVVKGVNLAIKKRFGQLAYGIAILQEAFRGEKRRYRIEVDGETLEAASLVVTNGRYYGGPFILAPAARLQDRRLYLCTFEKDGALNVMRYLAALGTGRLGALPDFACRPVDEVRIEGGNGEPLQIDGDSQGVLPTQIRAVDTGLKLLYSRWS